LISTVYGEEGVELVKKELPDIVILDLMLPDTSGFQVLRQIRNFSDVLLVILTAKGEEDNRIRGLQEGADDYIVKPFSAGELVARMKSLIRRRDTTKATGEIAAKAFTRRLSIDFANQTVRVDGNFVKIGPSSYELLHLLVTNEGMGFSKQELMKKVFPEHTDDADTRIVDVFINKLRERLEEIPNNPKIIIDEGTTGYKFVGSYSVVREALKEIES
jgi:DNA-binding response OmpR family regulator